MNIFGKMNINAIRKEFKYWGVFKLKMMNTSFQKL